MLGMLAGLAAGGAHASRQRWTSPLAGRTGRLMASLWPGLFWLCVLDAVLLVVGSPVVAGALDLAVPDLFVYSLFLVVVSMPLATLAGIAYHLRYALDEANKPRLARPGWRSLRKVVR
jgi:hypothetical protein